MPGHGAIKPWSLVRGSSVMALVSAVYSMPRRKEFGKKKKKNRNGRCKRIPQGIISVPEQSGADASAPKISSKKLRRERRWNAWQTKANGETFIYALIDPRSGHIRYIGKSNYPKIRYQQHLEEISGGVNTGKTLWLKELAAKNQRPELKILERVRFWQWKEKEREYIKKFRRVLGDELLNMTPGGD